MKKQSAQSERAQLIEALQKELLEFKQEKKIILLRKKLAIARRQQTEAARNEYVCAQFILQHIVISPDATPIGLPTLAFKFNNWYFENFRRKLTSIESETSLENSLLAPYFKLQYGTLYLCGCRVMSMPEEPLGKDELPIK